MRLRNPWAGNRSVLGMIAGGATGLAAVAKDLGADDRTVVVTQYLRVALVVLTMPLVVTYLFAVDTSGQTTPVASGATGTPWWTGMAFLAGAVCVGTGAAALIRLPIPATLGPADLDSGDSIGWPSPCGAITRGRPAGCLRHHRVAGRLVIHSIQCGGIKTDLSMGADTDSRGNRCMRGSGRCPCGVDGCHSAAGLFGHYARGIGCRSCCGHRE